MHYTTDTTCSLPDAELITKIKAGDTPLYEVIMRRYNQLLYRLARTQGLNHHDAEDVIQETHVAAFAALKNFRMESSYKTWVTKILFHKTWHKLNYGHLKYEIQYADVSTPSPATRQPGHQRDAGDMLANKELAKLIEESLQELPVIYRSVFVLREIEGFSIAESAEQLNISTSNVKVRLNRAKVLLRKRMEKLYPIDEVYGLNLVYCDKITQGVFQKINAEILEQESEMKL